MSVESELAGLRAELDGLKNQIEAVQFGRLTDGLREQVDKLEDQVARLKGKRDWLPFLSAIVVQSVAGFAMIWSSSAQAGAAVRASVAEQKAQLQVATGELAAAVSRTTAELEKSQSVEFHTLFRQALNEATSEDTRLASLTGICLQKADEKLAQAAKHVLGGLAATCWDTCEPKLAACRKKACKNGGDHADKACSKQCEDELSCDDMCSAYKKRAGVGGLCEPPLDLSDAALNSEDVVQRALMHLGYQAPASAIRDLVKRARGTQSDLEETVVRMASEGKLAASRGADEDPLARGDVSKVCAAGNACVYELP